MKARHIILGIAVLAIAGGGGYAAWRSATQNHDGRLVLYGNVDIREVDLAFNAEGKIDRINVDEGDKVKQGDLLAELDSGIYQHTLTAAQSRLAESQAQLNELEAGSRPAEIATVRAQVQQAKAKVAEAQSTLERQRKLLKTDDTSQQAFDAAQRAYDEAIGLRDQYQAQLKLAVEGPRQEKIQAARAAVDFNKATVELARERLADTKLLAPADGTILTRIREPGATVGTTSSVLTLAIRDPVRVRTYVDEPDLGRIKPGMPVEVISDSFPNKPYHGRIGFISPTAEFTPKTVETPQLRTDLVYRVRVIVANPDDGLRQGMPVTVRVLGAAPAGSGGATTK